jgi:probable rRNA maturation factor
MAGEPTIEVEIEEDAWLAAAPAAERLVEAAAAAALAGADFAEEAELTVLLTSDAEVRQLNRDFRKQDKPTNVLSFPADAAFRPHLGDVALAYETCAREAAEQDKSLDAHLSHLVAHGVLHLLGWDHQTDDEADAMEALERTVLAGLGYADPYAAQDGTDAQRRRPE